MTDKLRILWVMLSCAFRDWRADVWARDLDAAYCCTGRDCGCGGASVREVWNWGRRP